MKLRRDNLYATLLAGTAEERQWLTLTLRYHDRRGRYAGRENVPVFDTMNDRFPAGLLPDVGVRAREDGTVLDLEDVRGPLPPRSEPPPALAWLDAAQRDALGSCLHFGRGIVQMPTGAGKTEVFIAVALTYDVPVLWVAPRTQLATQARARWEARTDGAPSGLVAEKERTTGRVTFATFQALHRLMVEGHPLARHLLHGAQVLLADESHTGGAATFFPVLMGTPNARVRLGASATPLDRTDDRSVYTVGALGPVIHTIDAASLVASGRLVAPRVVMHRVKQHAVRAHPRDTAPQRACVACGALGTEPCVADCAACNERGAYFRRVYDELVVNSTERNYALAVAILAADLPALVFVKELAHARLLATLLQRHLRVEVVTGSKSTTARDHAITQLRRGDLDLVIATSVWEAGVDIPELRTVVNAGAGASDIRTVQVLGRVVRASAGKDACTMIDVADEGEPVLARHAQRRRRAYQREGWTVDIL